jgi:ATP-binding cassette subfamily B protein
MYTGPAIMYGINLVIVFILVIGYMISVNPMLTLYSLMPLPILSISIYYVNQLIEKRSDEIQKSLSRLSTFTQEAFSGIRVLKAFVREAASTKRFAQESEEYRHRSLQLNQINSYFFPLMSGLIGLSTILTVYVGGMEVMNGNITTGNIAEFVIYINMLTWPVTSLGWVTSIMQRSAASQKRIDEFMTILPEIVSPINKSVDVKGDITFKDVSFTYGYSGTKALKHVSFEVKAGESLAIMGTTGAGKSTIAQLIARMYDATTGQIFVDGLDIKDHNVSYLRKQMAQVPQDVFLFSDTIYNNVAFGKNDTKTDEVWQAVRDADLDANINGFPEGIETKIGERGITLSGGQKQRVSIARALIMNPRILVLDDCLSAVDTKTEDTILRNLKRLMEGKTTIIISHRVSSSKLADKVLILNDGIVVAQGKHEELLQENEWYLEQALKEQEGASVSE